MRRLGRFRRLCLLGSAGFFDVRVHYPRIGTVPQCRVVYSCLDGES